MVFGLIFAYFEPKILTQIQSKINAFFIGKNIEVLCKNDLILGGRGGPTNQFFAPWTHVGGTLAPQGTPGCPREGPDTLQRVKYSKIGAENHSKSMKITQNT